MIGTADVYEFRGVFVSYDDANRYFCETFADAAEAVGLFTETEATINIWVDHALDDKTIRDHAHSIRPILDD